VRKPASPQFNGPRYDTGNENLHFLARFESLVVHGPSADDCAIWIGAIGGEGPVLAESRRRGLPGARAPSPGPSEPALPTTKMLAASRCEFARLKPLDFHTPSG